MTKNDSSYKCFSNFSVICTFNITHDILLHRKNINITLLYTRKKIFYVTQSHNYHYIVYNLNIDLTAKLCTYFFVPLAGTIHNNNSNINIYMESHNKKVVLIFMNEMTSNWKWKKGIKIWLNKSFTLKRIQRNWGGKSMDFSAFLKVLCAKFRCATLKIVW